LNEDIKRRWVEALRSGQYRQTREQLVDHNNTLGPRYCCLGVLCEIAVADGVVRYDERDNTYVSEENPSDYNDTALPWAVARWAGLPLEDEYGNFPSEVPVWIEGAQTICLTTLNDGRDYNFDQIADVIEEKL